MGFRFRKSIKIAPGIKLNFNKKSTGLTFGGKGFHYTVNSKGKRTASVGIPGTGLSYSTTSGGKSSKKKKYSETDFIVNEQEGDTGMEKKSKKKGCLPAVIISLLIVGIIGSCGTDDTDTATATVLSSISEEYITEEVTTAPSAVAAAALTTIETTTPEETTADKETATQKQTTAKPTSTKQETTTKKETTTGKKTTATQKPSTTKKVTTTKKVVTTQKPTATKKVTTTKKKANTTEDYINDEFNGRTVYVTPSGERYHYDPECGGKNAYEVSIDNVGGRTPCKKCAQ